MKKFIILLCFIFSIAQAQNPAKVWASDALWQASSSSLYLQATANGSYTSQVFNVFPDLMAFEAQPYNGLLVYTCELDSVDAETGEDTLVFFSEYYFGSIGWVTGDTIQWVNLNDSTEFKTILTDSTDHGKKWAWRSKPNSLITPQGFGYNRTRLRIDYKKNGSTFATKVKNDVWAY